MTLTIHNVIGEVRKLAAERPDFNYREQPMEHPETRADQCSYVYASVGVTEGEGCIIGQALQRLGVSEETLLENDTVFASAFLLNLGVTETDLTSYRWIDRVQSLQDTGKTWGEAVSITDSTHLTEIAA